MINHWVGVGRMVEESPNLRYTANGKAVANFTLAVDNGAKGDGDKDTLFAPIVCWERVAEFVSNYGVKGRLMAVAGKWTQRSYEKDGQKRTVYEVVSNEVKFLDKPKGEQ